MYSGNLPKKLWHTPRIYRDQNRDMRNNPSNQDHWFLRGLQQFHQAQSLEETLSHHGEYLELVESVQWVVAEVWGGTTLRGSSEERRECERTRGLLRCCCSDHPATAQPFQKIFHFDFVKVLSFIKNLCQHMDGRFGKGESSCVSVKARPTEESLTMQTIVFPEDRSIEQENVHFDTKLSDYFYFSFFVKTNSNSLLVVMSFGMRLMRD